MTNEEKALELVEGNWMVFNKEYSAALKMAEWKDQQFKEYLEKKKAEYGVDYIVNAIDILDEIINEFFKEE